VAVLVLAQNWNQVASDWFRGRGRVQYVTLADVHRAVWLLQRHAAPSLIIDARDGQAYARGHIPGSVQVDQMKVPSIAMDAIVYCDGPWCPRALLVARRLAAARRTTTAKVYAGGWAEWTSACLPSEP
jgi:rhodanese-related sulfurtransferase